MVRAHAVAPLLSAILLVGGLGCGSDRGGDRPNSVDAGPAGAEVAYSFNPADKRELVATADNVFVGRVVKGRGTVSLPTSSPHAKVPVSRFAVEVLENVKGELRGTVTVSQFGGPVDVVVERGGERVTRRQLELWEGDPLLEAGEVLMLATDYDSADDPHTIVAQPFADRRIRSRIQRDRLVREFKQARRANRAKHAR